MEGKVLQNKKQSMALVYFSGPEIYFAKFW